MSSRRTAAVLVALVAASWLSPALVAGQEPAPAADPTAFRTAWGDPDLQGVWSYATFTPLERPDALAGREFLTPEEVAEQNRADSTRASSERRGELSRERDLALAYNQVWWDRGASTGRTSLIVDPPDGRLPPLTAEAARRQAALQRPQARPRLRFLGRSAAAGTLHDLPASAAGPVRLQQRVPHLSGTRPGRHSQRDDPRRARRAARRPPAHRRAHPAVERRRARPLGGRHARGRDHALSGRHDLARIPGHGTICARSSGSRASTTTPSTTGTRFTTRRPTPAPSPSSCRSRVRRATSSTSTRVTKGTTRSTTRWPASGPWRQRPGSVLHAGSNPPQAGEGRSAPGGPREAAGAPWLPSRIRHCRKERTA